MRVQSFDVHRILGWILVFATLPGMAALGVQADPAAIKIYSVAKGGQVVVERVNKPKEEWKKVLSPEAFHITREKGTERAFSGKYWNTHEKGVYKCVSCGTDLFLSDTKFESGTGWPSFWEPVSDKNVVTRPDNTFFIKRTEVLCARCDAHLGHVFKDGPEPSGLRYCMNSAALTFQKAE